MCECRQLRLEESNVDSRRQMEEGASGRGMDKRHQVAPLIAVLDRSQRALAVKTPDLVENRL
jgi:hypothetical protein